jgi:hypothetical protein
MEGLRNFWKNGGIYFQIDKNWNWHFVIVHYLHVGNHRIDMDDIDTNDAPAFYATACANHKQREVQIFEIS